MAGIRLDGTLDPPLSRWLWLVKWFLLIPHIIILAVLWLGLILSVIATFFALLFTARYPLRLFAYNLGVLRWSWRVAFYSYSTLGTDKYPPFTLDDVAEYPAHLSIDYPEFQRRGFRLIGRWLIGIPQYILGGIFAGGGVGVTWHFGFGGGVVGVLVFIAAILLLFKNRYPQDLFDFVMGFNRYVVRVLAYAIFMTPDYPPFRLDPGGRELTTSSPDAASGPASSAA
jgi:uncharacterized protein DUF4389